MQLLPNFLTYFAIGMVLLLVGTFLFEFTTKIKEWNLISQGNKAAAYVLGGKIVSLAIVLYSTIAHSVSIIDLIMWGGIAIVTQILAFFFAELFTPKFNLHQAIEQGNEAVGLFLFFLSIAIGILIAGCLTY
ncbi:MAG TPA: DUF350 domain-containing protein [Bacillota bacterium]|nr:DUF350 domain-containing protein [Bacillota bacterium]